MDVSKVFAAIDPIAWRGNSASINGIVYDSRQVQSGDLFVAMRGESTDGNRYLDAALAQSSNGSGGAVAIITDSRESYDRLAASHPDLPAALVEHGRRALARASAAILGHPERRLALTGVTGTNGKTTTAFLFEALLRSVHRTCVLLGTIECHVGNEIRPSAHTTPESRDVLQVFADGVRAGATEAVMEMSSHSLEQERVWGLPVDVAIFTNLTQDHLDYHGTMESYLAAKLKLFAGVGAPPPRVAVVNRDDPYGQRVAAAAAAAHAQVWTYGLEEGASFRATDIQMRAGETRFRMTTPTGEIAMRSALTGRVNVYNLLAASAAAWARGLTLEQIAAGATLGPQVPGRFQVVPAADSNITVVVDYAHTDDALRNLIALARELVAPSAPDREPGRVITLFGCGGDRDRSKRPKMGRAAGEGSDLVVLTSDNPRSEDPAAILAEALSGVEPTGTACIVEPDRRRGIELAIRSATPGDIVLLAGKGHEKVQILATGTIPFDDAAVAADIVQNM
ncbi:MAG TPA: UDP-N-acetylmuramoyl-L-alanyl-D-glutamate--2,6-diaminopimelate ligase [Granulicella sp.]|nr:UDP-N-acetylmuramoyl-L-alanyl-D-glutamate--2,6-diaminopimelate ligase [Granulicella sp.]